MCDNKYYWHSCKYLDFVFVQVVRTGLEQPKDVKRKICSKQNFVTDNEGC